MRIYCIAVTSLTIVLICNINHFLTIHWIYCLMIDSVTTMFYKETHLLQKNFGLYLTKLIYL